MLTAVTVAVVCGKQQNAGYLDTSVRVDFEQRQLARAVAFFCHDLHQLHAMLGTSTRAASR